MIQHTQVLYKRALVEPFLDALEAALAPGGRPARTAKSCVEIKVYGPFVLHHRVVLHAIDATPARWRGDAGSSPHDRAKDGHAIAET